MPFISSPGSCMHSMKVFLEFSAYCSINMVVARLLAQWRDRMDPIERALEDMLNEFLTALGEGALF